MATAALSRDAPAQAVQTGCIERHVRMIFVNLPVQDLERSKAFYEAIGFRNEPKFSNDAAAMMVLQRHHLGDAAHSSLLCNVHPQADCGREQQQSGAAVHFLRKSRRRSTRSPTPRARRAARSTSRRRTRRRAGRCTAATSKIPTAINGSRCGWTRSSPKRARIRSKKPTAA